MKGKFDAMVRQIQANTGLGPGYALRVMMAAPNSGWAKEAQKRLKSLKQARAKVPDSIPNPTSYHS
jgi:hypothetical protein